MKIKRRPPSYVQARCYDRFIPRRRATTACSGFCDDDALPPAKELDILSQDIRETARKNYRERLRSALDFPLVNRFILQGVGETHEESSAQWPVKHRKRPMMSSPDCALDLPEFKAMYYYNLLDWGPNGYLAAALNWSVFLCHPDSNKTIHLTDIDNPHLATRNGGEYGTSVKWDVCGQKLVIGTSKSNIQIWDTKRRKLTGEAWCTCAYQSQCSITSLVWSNCNNYLVSGCSSGKLTRILSPGKSIGGYVRAHEGAIYTLSYSPGGKYLASSGSDNVVRVWTMPHLSPHFEIIYDYPAKALAWHPWKPSLLAIGGGVQRGAISVYNINNFTKVTSSSPPKNCIVLSLAWSGYTGELVASYWIAEGSDVSSGSGRCEILVLYNLDKVVDKFMVGYKTQVIYLMWSPNGQKIATASTDETLRIWNFVPSDHHRNLNCKVPTKYSLSNDQSYDNSSFSRYIVR